MVGTDSVEVERRLSAGELVCPCGGDLTRWGYARRRLVRGVGRLRPRRGPLRGLLPGERDGPEPPWRRHLLGGPVQRRQREDDRYRALVFVNGWNTGQYVHDIGPQYEFTIPSGFLKPGRNTLAIAITAEEAGVGPDAVSLVNKWTVRGGVPSRPNHAPNWGDLHDW